MDSTYSTLPKFWPSLMVAESVEIFLDGQFWLDPEVFGPDQVAFARGMDVEHVNYRSWKSETKRYVVAESISM
jgi:hypothetical protein